MSEQVKRYDAVHIRYEDNNIRYGEGCEVEVVTARDYDALEAEFERLRAQVSALQSDANSWQSGYDKGREDGAKAAEGWKAQHARDSAELRRLCAERDALHAEAEALRVVLHEIASVNPSQRGIEWAKSYASDGLKGAGSELYARWLETFKEAEALRAERDELREELSGVKNVSTETAKAMKRLVMCARTSGGTAGPDAGLMDACEQAEKMLSLGGIGRAYMEGADATQAPEVQASGPYASVAGALAQRYPKPSLLKDCNVSYSNSSRPLAEQGERQEVWARQCDLDESDPALFVSRERVEESGYTVRLTTATQPSQDVRALLSADDVRDACANAVSVFAEEANADQCREVAEYMREVLLADLERAAPRQPDGDNSDFPNLRDGLEVVESLHVWRATNRFGDTCHFGDAGCARAWAGNGGKVDRIELKPVPELYDVNHADAAEVSATEIKVVAWAHCADATRLLCDLGKQRSVPGHYADEFTIPLCRLSDTQRAIAELREECEHLKDCQENAMLHMTGLVSERDTLRQQLAELRAQLLAIASAEPRRHTIEWAKAMAATGNNEAYAKWREAFDQRDRLAGLLADVKADYTHAIHWEDMHATMKRIDAALAEVKQ